MSEDRLLLAQLDVSIRGLERTMRKAGITVDAATDKMAKRWDKTARRMEDRTNRMSDNVRNAIAGIAVGLAGREVVRYADQFVDLSNKIAAASQVAGMQSRSLDDLQSAAAEARQELDPYVDLYARILRSSKGVAESEEDVAKATQLAAKAFKAGGTSAQEQAAGILQLGQALGSGFLQGDELRSIRENAPLVAKAIADAMDVSIGELKKLGAEGKLTSEIVFKALLDAEADIEGAFAVTVPRASDAAVLAFDKLKLKIGEFVTEGGTVHKVSAGMAEVIEFVANNLDMMTQAIIIGGAALAGYLGASAVATVITGLKGVAGGATAAARAMAILRAAVTFFGGPWVAGITIAAGALAALALQGNATEKAFDDLRKEIEQANAAMAATEKYVDRDLLGQIGDGADEAAPKVNVLAGALREVVEALNDSTIAQFIQDASTLQNEIEDVADKISEMEAWRDIAERSYKLTRVRSGQNLDGFDDSEFERQLGPARASLQGLKNRQAQIGVSIFGQGRGAEITDAILAGDIGKASDILRARLEQVSGSTTLAAGSGSATPTTPDDDANKKREAAIDLVKELENAYRKTFETERELIQRNLDENLAAIEKSAATEAEKRKARLQAELIYNDEIKKLDEEEAARKEEQARKEIDLVRDVQNARDELYGRTASLMRRDFDMRAAYIEQEIEDEARKNEALAALQDERAEAERLFRDELLNQGEYSESELERMQAFHDLELIQLQDALNNKLITLEEYNAAREAMTAERAAKERDIELQAQSSILSSTQNFAGQMSSLAAQRFGESSGLAKAFFLAEKAAAAGSVIVQSEIAKARALAELGPIAGAPAVAAIEANKFLSLGTIAAQTIMGFKDGVIGLRGPGTGTSDSIPAYLSAGESVITARGTSRNREVLEMANRGIDVAAALSGRGGGGSAPVVNVYNNAPNSNAITQRNSDGSIDVIIEAVENKLKTDLARGGGFSSDLASTFGLNRANGLA